MKGLHMVTFILLAIGGLNWLLYVLGWEIGDKILGGMNGTVATIVYVLVGISALIEIFTHKKNCRMCGTAAPKM